MKAMKKVLAMGLALAMVVTAVPVTSAEAASAKLPAKKTYYVGKTNTLKLNATKVKKTAWSKTGAAVKLSAKAKKSVKVTAVKAGTATVKAKVTYTTGKPKTYSCKVTVKNPVITVPETATVAVNSKVSVAATKKAPSSATVAYKSADEATATVDAKTGEVTGVKAGTVEITATLTCGTKTVDAKTTVTVKKAIVKEAVQTEYNKIEAVIVGDTTNFKAGDFKVTNKSTNGTVPVKSVSAKADAENTFVIETFTGMTDAKEYSVAYEGTEAAFTATDGTVASVGISRTEVPAGELTKIELTTMDAKGVVLGYTPFDNADSSKGKVTADKTYTKGYIDGSKIQLPSVGDTMTVKVIYHSGSFGTDGSETGTIEGTFTITAVDPSLVGYNYALTIGSAPVWNAASFTASNKVKIGATANAYFRITKDDGSDIKNYGDYKVESADKTKLLVTDTALTDERTAVVINGVSEGTTYILIKKDGNTVASLPVVVLGKPVATTLDLSAASVTVVTGSAVVENVTATLKDQYGDELTSGVTYAVDSLLAKPNGSSVTAGVIVPTGKVFPVKGISFDLAGAYTFKLKATYDNKTVYRTLTVNATKGLNDTTQAYEVRIDKTEVDTTIQPTTVTSSAVSDAQITITVARKVNGGATTCISGGVEFTIKNAKGDVIANVGAKSDATLLTTATGLKTCAAVDDSAYTAGTAALDTSVKVNPLAYSEPKFDKNLVAGTYYVTAVFKGDDGKLVTVGGSFVIKDTQDSKASVQILNNKFEVAGTAKTVTAAFEGARDASGDKFVKVFYDGIEQKIDAGDVKAIHGTKLANGGAYITTVEVYVTVTGTAQKVPVTLNVNDQIAVCDVNDANWK